jgi:hypothetical protein
MTITTRRRVPLWIWSPIRPRSASAMLMTPSFGLGIS